MLLQEQKGRMLFFKRLRQNSQMNEIDSTLIIRMSVIGVLVGAVAGFFGATFRYWIMAGEDYRHIIMNQLTPLTLGIWLVAMVVFGWACARLLKWAPLSGGSGIPQIEGEMLGVMNDTKPHRTLISKYIGGVLNGICGFSVGREGPSVQLGGAAGKIISYLLHSPRQEQRLLMSAGAAAGLTAAFSAPVSGAIFAFEEVHKSFYPLLVIPTFTATIASNFVTSTIFGLQPSLGFTVMDGLPLHYFYQLIGVGLISGVVGVAFNKSILLFKRLFSYLPMGLNGKIIMTFLVVTLIGLDSQLLLGGGNSLVGELAYGHYALWILLGIVVGKILLTAFCFGSGIQGGIFLPMLVIGASVGAFTHGLFHEFGLVTNVYQANIVICAMSGVLAAAMRTPLLAIMLVLEMTNSFFSIYQVGTVAIVAYLVADLMKEPPVYDSLLGLMIKPRSEIEMEQTFFQCHLPVVSPLVGKALQDIVMPKSASLVSISRQGQHIVPQSQTILEAGDDLYVTCQTGQLKEAKEFFQKESVREHEEEKDKS